jgi:hypothetical protein
MSKWLILGIFLAVVASAITAGAVVVVGQGGGSGEGEYGTLYIDVGPLTGNTTTSYGAIDTCIGDLSVGTPFDIDIIIDGANDLGGAGWTLYYNKDVLKVTAYNWASWKLGGGRMNFTDAVPDTDGAFAASYARASGVNGAGVLQRLTLQPIATGSSDLKLCTAADCLSVADSRGGGYFYPKVLVDDPAGEVRAVVGGACPRGGQGAGGGGTPEVQATPEVQPTPEEVLPPSPVAAPKGGPVDRAKQATEADRAKPRFTGELGDFVIVEPHTGTGYPCPEPAQPGTNPERSELYFSLAGAVIEGVGSCQGTIFSITASVPDGVNGAMVGRGYFPGPKLEEPFDAPAERLKLITVGGMPALAELPIPDCMVCPSQVVVIQRFPSEEAPGITVWALTTNDLDKAIALAEQIMGVRQ